MADRKSSIPTKQPVHHDDFTGTLKQHGVTISMDGKGR